MINRERKMVIETLEDVRHLLVMRGNKTNLNELIVKIDYCVESLNQDAKRMGNQGWGGYWKKRNKKKEKRTS